MTIGEFLARAAATPFAWGRSDCCLWLADWVADQRGLDPAAHLRGRYATALGCARLLKREGGLAAVVTRCAELAGLAEVTAPAAGCVGLVLVQTAGGTEPVGAIHTGRRWAVRGQAGLIVGPAPHVMAWGV